MAWVVGSLRLVVRRGLCGGAEGFVEVGAGQLASVVLGDPSSGEGQIQLVFCLLEELFPDLHGHNDALGSSMRAEVHRFALTSVEALGDLVQRVACLACGHYVSHEDIVRETVRIWPALSAAHPEGDRLP
jgi:hypothetical protein